jgi:hypothetical protein
VRRRRGNIGRATLTAALLVLGAALAPAPAGAQDGPVTAYLDAVDAWATGERLRQLLPDETSTTTRPSKPTKPKQRPRQPTRRQLAALRFERTDAIRQQNYQAIMDRLEPGYDPAAVVAEFDRLLAQQHGNMRKSDVRVSSSNIADVAAWTLLLSYAQYHERTTLSDRGVRAVRDAARRSFALDRQARRLADAEAQQVAEKLELRTYLRLGDLFFGRQNADAPREQAALDELSTWIQDVYGVDLERVRFTRKGLVER